MTNTLRSAKEFKGNLTAMAGCSAGRRKDIGLVAPKHLTDGFEPLLEKNSVGSISGIK